MSKVILFYDETKEEAQTFAWKLKEHGFQAKVISDPKEFLIEVKKLNPDSCFFNTESENVKIQFALIKTIRKMLSQSMQLVAFLPKGGSELSQKFTTLGINKLLEKPVKPSQVLDLINEKSDQAANPEPAKPAIAIMPEQPSNQALPKFMDWFFENIFSNLAAINPLLSFNENIEIELENLKRFLLPHQVHFLAMIASMRKSETKLDFNQSLRLYGLSQTRYLVSAFKLCELLKLNFIAFDPKTSMLKGDVRKIIPYAIRNTEYFGEDSIDLPLGYTAGLLLDFFSLLAENYPDLKSPIRRQLEAGHSETLRKVTALLKKAKDQKDLSLSKHITTLIFMQEAAKTCLTLFAPDYLEVRKWYESKGIKPVAQNLFEFKKYQITHSMIAAMLCQILSPFDSATNSCLFFDMPFLIKNSTPDHHAYKLAQFIATN